jgi:hypothetical protein
MTDNETVRHAPRANEEQQPRGLRVWLNKHKGADLYHAADPPAQWVKAIVQMAIGIGTVITIAVVVWFPELRSGGIAELALKVVAAGLALAAVVELTYTLFTDGPDEALDPLILGLSSFILLKISDPGTDLTLSNAGTVAILVLALAVLFILRHQFIGKAGKDQAGKKAEEPGAAEALPEPEESRTALP